MMDSKVHILAFLGGLRRRDTRREPSLLSSEYTAGMLESIFGVKIVRWNVSSLGEGWLRGAEDDIKIGCWLKIDRKIEKLLQILFLGLSSWS